MIALCASQWILVLLWYQVASVSAQSCTSSSYNIGSVSTPEWTPNTTSYFFLNIEEHTPCPGYVTRVQISYYPSSFASAVTRFAFYIPEDENKDNFIRMSEVYEVQHLTNSGNDEGMIDYVLPQSLYVWNDTALGACVPPANPTQGQGPLLVVSRDVRNVTYDRLVVDACDGGEMPPKWVGLPTKDSIRPSLLHIHAIVEGGNGNNGMALDTSESMTNTTEMITPATKGHNRVITAAAGATLVTALLFSIVICLLLLYFRLARKGRQPAMKNDTTTIEDRAQQLADPIYDIIMDIEEKQGDDEGHDHQSHDPAINLQDNQSYHSLDNVIEMQENCSYGHGKLAPKTCADLV